MEASGQLRDVEEEALGGTDGAQVSTGGATNAAVGATDGLLEGAVLLSVLTVGAEVRVLGADASAEALGESAGGRGGMRVRSVVNRLRNGAAAEEADARDALGVSGGLAKGSRGSEHVVWNLMVVVMRMRGRG